jgi:hypothetical protein
VLTWQRQLESIANAAVDPAAFGEPITLADASVISAVFTLNNPTGWGYGTELTDALEQQPQPTLHLTDADASTHAAQLSVGALITARATTYAIAEPPEPDGHGLTRLALMATQPQDSDPAAGAQRWR